MLEPLASRQGDRAALISYDSSGLEQRFDFKQVARLAYTYGNSLGQAGARPGEVIFTLIGSTPEWVATMLGIWRIGAVALPCNEMLRAKDLVLRLNKSRPAVVVAAERNLPALRSAIEASAAKPRVLIADDDRLNDDSATPMPTADTASDDPALIVFTSGTAGEPRPALHAQRYLWGQSVQAKHWMDVRLDDIVWCTAATGWSKSSRNVFVAPWHRGATAVVHDTRFDPSSRQEIVARAGVTVLCQAPTEYRMIAKQGRPDAEALRSLRHLVSAGEPLNPEVIRVFRVTIGLEIHDSYGQTETGALTAMPPGEPVRAGSMGKALPGFNLEIRAGELCVHPPSVPTIFQGYADGRPVGSQWYRTGDRVRLDDDGYFWFEGRGDDVILSAGYRIGPFEVESALIEHPAVAEAAAVAAPDEERGTVVKAFVVLRQGTGSSALAGELQNYVKEQTAPYKYPRQIEFVPRLPKTASGKIKRAELRSRDERAAPPGTSAPSLQ